MFSGTLRKSPVVPISSALARLHASRSGGGGPEVCFDQDNRPPRPPRSRPFGRALASGFAAAQRYATSRDLTSRRGALPARGLTLAPKWRSAKIKSYAAFY